MREDAKRLMTKISRRTFIRGAAAVGLLAMLPVARGCAKRCHAKVNVAIIGGGAAGLSMAARLARRLPNATLTLIDPADKQFYQPGFTLIGAGVYKPDVVWKNQSDCIPDRVKWIKQAVVALDPTKKEIRTGDGGRLTYDFLVLTPGLQLNWSQIQGISLDTLGEGNAHSIYDFNGAQKTFPAMMSFIEKGGRALFTDTYTKLKCGGAPKKICLLTEHQARMRKRRDAVKIDYFTASKQLYDVPHYTPRLEEIYQERKVSISLRMRLTGVDTQAKKAFFEKTTVSQKQIPDPASGAMKTVEESATQEVIESYDFLHFTPPQSAPDFVREAGLGWRSGKLAREAWVEVDKETLVHAVHPSIIALGDVAGIPTSKTSAAIRKQVPIAVENLIALIEGKTPEVKYDGYAACPIVTDYGHVILCEFDYDKKPKTSFPFTLMDTRKELWSAWLLKVYFLKPFYFYGMIKGHV
ncbi:MAG: FAD-dependent oxidoreductase [Kiritimatiellae bacterium]|nr:FAD-dependent oxidoreductase [Kiritimatiellia bacterium]